MKNTRIALGTTLLASLGIAACGGGGGGNGGDSGSDDPGTQPSAPQTYSFDSRFSSDSSVAYSGQVARQVLIADLRREIDSGLADRISSGQIDAATTADEVVAILESYYDGGTDDLAANPLLLTTTPPTAQSTYGEISSGKNLRDKTAGNDDATDHVDWDGGGFAGWNGAASPEALVRGWFDTIAENAVTEAGGSNRTATVDGTTVELSVYHTENGVHLGQMVQKFLLGAVAYSQATDDYLDDDTEGKGLLTDNAVAADNGASPFTALEHQYDEGFGYFGAARDYNDYTDSEIADDVYRDSDENGRIDLGSEYNFDLAGYAAKRDLGSQSGTDFSATIFDAFLSGRAIISGAEGDLTDAELAELQSQRDVIVGNWEKVLAANVIHYANSTLADLDAWAQSPGTETFAALAAHWSEMKAFALGLQFNPRMTLTDQQFADFHAAVGQQPVLPGEDGFQAYRDDLVAARDLIGDAYGFDDADVANW